MLKFLPLLAVCALCWTASVAVAAPASEEKLAESLVVDAKTKYQAGQYEAAAKLYMEAYGHVQKPGPVFNAARAYEAAGLYAEAKPLYELYIQIDRGNDADSVAGREDAQKRLTGLMAKMAEQEKKKTVPAPVVVPPPVAPQPVVTPPPVTPPPVAKPVVRDPPPAVQPPRDPPPSLYERPTPPADDWTTQKTVGVASIATGGALIVASIIVGVVARSDLASLNARLDADHVANNQGLILHSDVTQPQMDDGIATYNHRQVVAGVLGGVGAAAVVTGAVLWWLDDGQPAARPRVQPSVSLAGGGALLTFSGQF